MADKKKFGQSSLKYYYDNGHYRKVLFSPLKKQGYIPEKGSELYVSNIPEDATVYDLAKFFEKAGEVFQVRLMMKSNNKQNRGFAYVSYVKKEYAMRALIELKDVPFFANVLLVMQKSVDNCRIFLGGVPLNKTKDEIWHELISTYKISNIVDVITYRSYGNPSYNRGFVFLEFRTHEEASYFRAKYTDKLTLFGKNLLVDWSIPVLEPEEEEMANVKIIYLRNLNVIQSSEEFNKQINRLIERKKVDKIYKFKDYSYIHLKTRKDAEWLMGVLKEYYKYTDVEITWAKPPNKFNDPVYRQKTLLTRRNCSYLEPMERCYGQCFCGDNCAPHTTYSPPMGRPLLNNINMQLPSTSAECFYGEPSALPDCLPSPPTIWKQVEVLQNLQNREYYEFLMREFPPLPTKKRGERVNRRSLSDSQQSSSSYQSSGSSFEDQACGTLKNVFSYGDIFYSTSPKQVTPMNDTKSYYNIFEMKNLYDIGDLGGKSNDTFKCQDGEDSSDEELEALTISMVNQLLMD